jgi:hypothetical protein
MNYISPQPTVYSRIVGIFTWIWGKSFGLLIEFFKLRMCVPTWFATILWLIFLGMLGTAIWGIVNYVRGVKELTPKCAACPNAQAKPSAGTFTLTPV